MEKVFGEDLGLMGLHDCFKPNQDCGGFFPYFQSYLQLPQFTQRDCHLFEVCFLNLSDKRVAPSERKYWVCPGL